MTNKQSGEWSFVKVGLIVTGETEEDCLPDLFRALAAQGTCHFKVIRRIGQRSPIKSERRQLRMVGTGKTIPDIDASEIGLPAREFMESGGHCVMLVDDLEFNRSEVAAEVFRRYRLALDTMLMNRAHRAAVHFLVNMLEAYYLADAKAVNHVLGTNLEDFNGDVETIPNPNSRIRAVHAAFDKKEHGPLIVRKLDVRHILSRADSCASLRTMFAWAAEATRSTLDLPHGTRFAVTEPQIRALREVS